MISPVGIGYVKPVVRPRVFVSYHHGGDQGYYNSLSAIMQSNYTLVHDNSLDRVINSDDVDYVMRKIRDEYLTGTSCTIVLCGMETPNRKYVDWEIMATLQKEHALIGLKLPTVQVVNDGCSKPARLQDNIDSGFAVWAWFEDVYNTPSKLDELVREARGRSKSLINNSRARRIRNG